MGVFDSFHLDNPIKCNCGEVINNFQSKTLDGGLGLDFFVRKNGVLECLRYNKKKESLKDFNKAVNIYSSCSQEKCWIELGLLFENGILIGKTVTISQGRSRWG